MGADQFLLTWNNHRSNFAEVFSQLRVQDQLVDVTLLCDGGSYPAHRLVLAACSPYFHQLFTRLPTQHPIVYLRDVRQAELEALLEFIYRGEVSVANSELTGLIKIAESLRIKGLGDVSQRDPAPFSKSEKRSATPYSNSSSPNSSGRPRKTARLAMTNTCVDNKIQDGVIPPLLSSNFCLRPATLSHLLENPTLAGQEEGDHDSQDRDSPTPPPFKESKLRSCLEGQETLGMPFANLLAQPGASRLVGGLLRREMENREAFEKKKINKVKAQQFHVDSFNNDTEKEEKPVFSDIKQETLSGEEPSSPLLTDQDALLLPQLTKLYEPGDFSNSFLTKYTQLLNSFHQQQQVSLVNHHERGEDEVVNFPSLIPTTVQEHPIPISPKDAKSLTCNLCGATIKHIANFRRHMKQHLNPRRFPCPWCSAAFGRKDNLKTHTRKHHPAEVEAQELNISASTSLNESANSHNNDCHIERGHHDDADEGNEDDGQVYNGIGGETSSPINEDEDSGDQNGEDDSLIIVDEGDDEDEDEEDCEKSLETSGEKEEDEESVKENGSS